MKLLFLVIILAVYHTNCLRVNKNLKRYKNDGNNFTLRSPQNQEKEASDELDLLQYLVNTRLLKNKKFHSNLLPHKRPENNGIINKPIIAHHHHHHRHPQNGVKITKSKEKFHKLNNFTLPSNDDHMPLLDDGKLHDGAKTDENIPENPLSGTQYADALYDTENPNISDEPLGFNSNSDEETKFVSSSEVLPKPNTKNVLARKANTSDVEQTDPSGSFEDDNTEMENEAMHDGNVKTEMVHDGNHNTEIVHDGNHKIDAVHDGNDENEGSAQDESNLAESRSVLGLINLSGWHSKDNEKNDKEQERVKQIKTVHKSKKLQTNSNSRTSEKHNIKRKNQVKSSGHTSSKLSSVIKSDALTAATDSSEDLNESYGEGSGEETDDHRHMGSGFLEKMIGAMRKNSDIHPQAELTHSFDARHQPQHEQKEKTKKTRRKKKQKQKMKKAKNEQTMDLTKTRLNELKSRFSNVTVLFNLNSTEDLGEMTDSYIGKSKKMSKTQNSNEISSNPLADARGLEPISLLLSTIHHPKQDFSKHLKHRVQNLRENFPTSKTHKRKTALRNKHLIEDRLPDMTSKDPEITSDLTNSQMQERTFFRTGHQQKNHKKYDTRKDEIPHPPSAWKRDEISYRRDELPEYSLPPSGSMLNTEQLLAYPAQYPELLNLQPMNKLYTSVQGLDMNEEDLLGRYLKKERQEEASFSNTDPDKLLQTDDKGNLFQEDLLSPGTPHHHVTPTKLLDQNTLNDITKADAKTLAGLTRLDSNVLKDTSKIGQNKLMGASVLGSDELSSVLNLLKQNSKNVDSFSAKEIAHGLKQDNGYITAVQKLASDKVLTNKPPSDIPQDNPTEKAPKTSRPSTNINKETSSALNTVSALHDSDVHRQAAHLMRNLAIRKKLMRIKLLEAKLRTLKRLEQSRRKHLLSTPTVSPLTSTLNRYINNFHGLGLSPDVGLLKHFFGNNHEVSKPTNKSSMFQDALYDRGKILKWKYRDVIGDKKQVANHMRPTQLDEVHLTTRKHNFHLAHSNLPTGGNSNQSKSTTKQINRLDEGNNIAEDEIDELKSILKKGEDKVKSLKEKDLLISEIEDTDKKSSNIVKENDNEGLIDETVTENGIGRSMNEFKFNGQVKLDPNSKGNVKIVHGTPPPEFQHIFATTFPHIKKTTPFGPFFTLPPGHATQQPHLPTFKSGYPWVWYKNRKIPVKVVADLNPTSSPHKEVINPTRPTHRPVTNTQPPNMLIVSTAVSPLAEEYTLLKNLTGQKVEKPKDENKVQSVESIQDGEIQLENDKPMNNSKALVEKAKKLMEAEALVAANYVSPEIELEDPQSSLSESKDSPTPSVAPPAVHNFLKDEKIAKNKSVETTNITPEGVKQTESSKNAPAPIFITYEQNSKHHKLQPDDIILSDDMDKESAETKTYIHLKQEEEGKMKENKQITSSSKNDNTEMKDGKNGKQNSSKFEVLKVLNPAVNPHELPHQIKSHELKLKTDSEQNLLGTNILKENFDMNKADKIFLASKHIKNMFHSLPSKELEKVFHLHSKPGSLYFEKTSHDDQDESPGDKRQLYSSYEELQERSDSKDEMNNAHEIHTVHEDQETLKKDKKPTSKLEDFEIDDKQINEKQTPTSKQFLHDIKNVKERSSSLFNVLDKTPTSKQFVDNTHEILHVEKDPDVSHDQLLEEYEEQSKLNERFTNEILNPNRKHDVKNLTGLSDNIQAIIHTNTPTKPLVEPLLKHEDVQTTVPPPAETTTPTTTSSTTLETTTTTMLQQVTTKLNNKLGIEGSKVLSILQQPLQVDAQPTLSTQQATNVIYPTARLTATERKAVLPLGPHDIHEITSLEHLTQHHNNPALLSPPERFYQPAQAIPTGSTYSSMVAPGAMIIEQKSQPKQAVREAKMNGKSSPVESIVMQPADKQVLTLDLDKSVVKSPFEDELNLDDMYWTDSPDEIEHACKKQKATNLVVNILAFGDSLTRGYYNRGKNHHPYTMKLQYLLNKMDAKRCFIVENEGKDGDFAIGEMPKRIEEVLKEKKKSFDWVIILGGTNDIYNKKNAGHHTTTELTQNILAVHNIAHHYGSRTVAVTIPDVECESNEHCQDMKEMRHAVNNNIRTFASDHKQMVILCDLADSLVRHKISHKLVGQFFEGGLHLKPRGYETMAKLIFETLRQTLDKR